MTRRSSLGLYILKGKIAYPCEDTVEWSRMLADADARRVAQDTVPMPSGDLIHVSTVFLGIDHSFGPGDPLLFETMIFGGPLDREQWRYSYWDEAEAGHAVALAMVRELLAPRPPSSPATSRDEADPDASSEGSTPTPRSR